MLSHIISRLIVHTIISGILGGILGSVMGFVVGAIRQRIKDTVYVSRVGAFLGCLLVSIFPPISSPGSLETWGMAGGLGSLQVVITIILIALGGLAGSFIASTFGFGLFLKARQKLFVWVFSGTYILLAIALWYGYLQSCTSSISYSYC